MDLDQFQKAFRSAADQHLSKIRDVDSDWEQTVDGLMQEFGNPTCDQVEAFQTIVETEIRRIVARHEFFQSVTRIFSAAQFLDRANKRPI